MKRRNAEGIKPRRSVKPRSKIDRLTEGFYGSTFLYLKFLMVWALVLMADFIVEFRFEYLWPFWLLLRSVYDSFKYQGLAFSVFFVCIAITSDVICYLFIPVQWLFFAASTYVWVQYVWHTERGICLPTVSLWLIFVYIEASVRLRDFSIKSHPFHLDLCRPFAAHCIGYPVVTLGFGFKSYISYKLRLRRQVVVRKENDFYVQLLQQALPPEQQNAEKAKATSLPAKSQEETISNGVAGNTAASPVLTAGAAVTQSSSNTTPSNPAVSLPVAPTPAKGKSGKGDGSPTPPCTASDSTKDNKKHNNVSGGAGAGGGSSLHIEDLPFLELHKNNGLNSCEEENLANEQHARTYQNKSNGVAKGTPKLNSSKDNTVNKGKSKPNNTPTTFTNNKDEVISRLESDIKRLKADLQASRNVEQDLRSQINNLVIGDKSMKTELYQLRQDNESLQNKLHNLVTSRQQDKHSLAVLERRLQEERKQRTTGEQQLAAERKKRQEDQSARAQANRGECTESCKARRRELENEVKQIRRETKLREDQIRQLERETETLRQYKDAQSETEVLMSALHAMQDKNTHLETSLSAETRVKMDLFSALGDANRRIEIQQNLLVQRESEVDDLKSKIAEVVAVTGGNLPPVSYSDPMPRFSTNFANTERDDLVTNDEQERVRTSTLNPHASDYTPKVAP